MTPLDIRETATDLFDMMAVRIMEASTVGKLAAGEKLVVVDKTGLKLTLEQGTPIDDSQYHSGDHTIKWTT